MRGGGGGDLQPSVGVRSPGSTTGGDHETQRPPWVSAIKLRHRAHDSTSVCGAGQYRPGQADALDFLDKRVYKCAKNAMRDGKHHGRRLTLRL